MRSSHNSQPATQSPQAAVDPLPALAAALAPEPPVQKLAFTVKSFCKAHEISTPTYYRLRKEGRGPREMRIGSDIRISAEAAADWRRAREEDGMR